MTLYEVCFYRDNKFIKSCPAENRSAADLLALEADRERLDVVIYYRDKAVQR
jgi:hypothetical protein